MPTMRPLSAKRLPVLASLGVILLGMYYLVLWVLLLVFVRRMVRKRYGRTWLQSVRRFLLRLRPKAASGRAASIPTTTPLFDGTVNDVTSEDAAQAGGRP